MYMFELQSTQGFYYSYFPLRCGSGLSGDYLTEEGHYWVGVDISTAMLG